jgi:hypothetical protein
MKQAPALLAASPPLSARLLPALREAGFEVTCVAPRQASPERVGELAPRVLILECSDGESPAPEGFWEGREMDAHLPILLLRSGPSLARVRRTELDEPIDEVAASADPGEIAARASGLLKEGLIRIFRKTFHDMSQPLTIARALSTKALKLSSPALSVDATLQELDRQVDRIFRVAEDLQRRRLE